MGWERIRDMIRTEEYLRLHTDPGAPERAERTTVLSRLNLDEFLHLRRAYLAHTPKVRVFFCLMAALTLLWDVMLVCTALFFHIMIEKVAAACAAVLLWFVLYRGIYVHPWSPGLPGEGPFKYVSFKAKQQAYQRRQENAAAARKAREGGGGGGGKWVPKDELPKFMGMPLYALNQKETSMTEAEAADVISPVQGPSSSQDVARRGLRRPRSRSGSASRLSSSKSSLGGARYH